ncbi:MAG: hypothetical protein JJU22_00590 [Gammaproteobacteria bacterium]|nr:hypothetical protein [Gammaproteobacteria bacterium]
MSLPVKLRDVAQEMQISGDFLTCYINVKTGELVSLSEETMRYVDEEDTEWMHQWQLDEVVVARKVLESDDYIELPESGEVDNWSLMEAFALARPNAALREQILEAIDGRGAFRRFKDLVDHIDLLDQWYAFRDAAFEEAAAEFLEFHEVPYTRD